MLLAEKISLSFQVWGGFFSLKPPSLSKYNHAWLVRCLLILAVKFATTVQHWETAAHILLWMTSAVKIGLEIDSQALPNWLLAAMCLQLFEMHLSILLQLWCMLWKFWLDNAWFYITRNDIEKLRYQQCLVSQKNCCSEDSL